jgi:UDP-glucose 4-epimerase
MCAPTEPELPQLTGQSVVITGGAGFIGSHLADRLADTCDVTVLDNLSAGRRDQVPAEAELVPADVRDTERLEDVITGADVVFHQAALVSVNQSIERPVESHEINLDATLHLLECAADANARVVLASSTAIYGDPATLPVTEPQPKSPSSPYGLDKLAVDNYARLYSELYGLETVALRYFNVYGPRQRGGQYGGVISIFIDQALSGGPITVHGDGTQTRDFVHVRDVVDANVRAAQAAVSGEAFNIGTGTETSIMELAETARTAVGTDVDITHEAARPGDIERSRADISKATRDLGFSPSVPLQEGIERVVTARQ